ncbi:MAG: serine hydrolase domain-containing protein [Actinomycetota bacterium]
MTAQDVAVGGFVASGFEGVRDVFAANAGDAGDGGFAYSVFCDGAKVVDLWTGQAGDRPWSENTTGLWASTTKAMTALAVQILWDRKLIDVDAPVATYWPEFASKGKDKITVADVMTHRSGVVGSPVITEMISLDDGTGLDRTDDIVAALAEAEPVWEPGTKTGYHTVTFGWLLGEVIRRIDGRDLGTFFREEVALPLGVPRVRIGTPVDEHADIAPVLHNMWPDAMPEPVKQMMEALLQVARDPSTPAGVSCFARDGVGILDRIPETLNAVPGRTPPLGASNMVGTARDVAKIFNAIVQPIDGVQLVSEESTRFFTEIRNEDDDIILGIPIARALGYWRNKAMGIRPQSFGPNEAAFGHTGAGGQIGYSDPVAKAGVAFVRSHHTLFGIVPLLLNAALYQALA